MKRDELGRCWAMILFWMMRAGGGPSTAAVSAFAILPAASSRAREAAQYISTSSQIIVSAAASTDQTESSSTTDNIAKEEILRHGLAKMHVVMTPEFFAASPLLKQFYSKLCKSIEVQPSSIPGAGLGLFAKKNIKANTIVSFYPCHALGVDTGASSSSFVTLDDEADRRYFASHPSHQSGYLHCTDQPIFERPSILGNNNNQQQEPLYLDVNPERDLVPGWVSQMINDGATVTENTETGVLDYYQKSGAAKNCIHIPFGPSPILATVTTRKVKQGEELLTSYGGTYWLGVWLDLHGAEGVAITKPMEEEIQASARDLRRSMQSARLVYANQLEALQIEFDKIGVE